MTQYLLSVLILALLLFLPVSKLVWVLSVRRLRKKLGRELSEQEIDGQLSRARVITVFVIIVFSILFNLSLLGNPFHG